MKMDPFIEAEEAAGHSVKHCCDLFEVSRAAYYERKQAIPTQRELADAELTEKIIAVHAESKGTYGSPRVHQELVKRGVACGRRRVRRLMRRAGLEGRCKKRWRKTTVSDPAAERAKDLIGRHFGPCTELDRRYVGDITYIMTWEGWAYLATVIDLASRRVVGWALADHMRTELVEDALKMAFVTRRPDKGVIFHSDRGSQGGFNRSSQHLDDGGGRWRRGSRSGGRRGRRGASSVPQGDRLSGGVTSASCFGSRSRRAWRPRRRPGGSGWHPRSAPGGSGRLAVCDRSPSNRCPAGACPSPSARRSRSAGRGAWA